MGIYSMVEKERARQNVTFCGARIELVVFISLVFFLRCAMLGRTKRNVIRSPHTHTLRCDTSRRRLANIESRVAATTAACCRIDFQMIGGLPCFEFPFYQKLFYLLYTSGKSVITTEILFSLPTNPSRLSYLERGKSWPRRENRFYPRSTWQKESVNNSNSIHGGVCIPPPTTSGLLRHLLDDLTLVLPLLVNHRSQVK
jgi:hypothetical protein